MGGKNSIAMIADTPVRHDESVAHPSGVGYCIAALD